jgi:hypothetical protein
MRYFVVLLITYFVAVSLSLAKTVTLHYAPEKVTLAGKLRLETFPGPPNYESISDGDAIEAGAYLILDQPIQVDLYPGAPINTEICESNVRVLHIASSKDIDWKMVRQQKHVVICGTLFHALTGHHHSRVLIWAEQIKEIH